MDPVTFMVGGRAEVDRSHIVPDVATAKERSSGGSVTWKEGVGLLFPWFGGTNSFGGRRGE